MQSFQLRLIMILLLINLNLYFSNITETLWRYSRPLGPRPRWQVTWKDVESGVVATALPSLDPTCHKNGINGFVEKPKCNEVYLATRRPMGSILQQKLWGINESMSAKIQPTQRNTSQHLHPYEEQCVAHAQWTLQVIVARNKNEPNGEPKTRKLYTGWEYIYILIFCNMYNIYIYILQMHIYFCFWSSARQ